MTQVDISAVLTLHREGMISVASLRSFLQCCAIAEESGLSVERVAVLDGPDDTTRLCFSVFAPAFQRVLTVELGDQAAARNAATEEAVGEHLAFFDGDDLWGAPWLREAILHSRRSSTESVWHPDVCYVFHPSDFVRTSLTTLPHPDAQSCFLIHPDSCDPQFDLQSLFFSNVWTSNSFAPTGLYRAHPFPRFRREAGFGIEDWSWNYHTLRAGVAHRFVPNTVHMVRVKESGSQVLRNLSERLLPDLHGS